MDGTPELINAFHRLSVKERNAHLFQLLVEVGAKTIVVEGENGEIEGLVSDRTVMLKYFKNRVWASETVACARLMLAGGGTYIDLGANIGLTTVPIARIDGVACIAVEAMPENARLLRLNLVRNDVADRVTIHTAAIAPQDGPITLEVAPANKGDHRIRTAGAPTEGRYGEALRNTTVVDGRPLSALVDPDDLVHPVVMKLDIQGAEPFALDSGAEIFRQTDLLLTEYWPYGLARLGHDPLGFLKRLAALYPYAAHLPDGASPDDLEFKLSEEVVARLVHFGDEGAIEATDIAFARAGTPF